MHGTSRTGHWLFGYGSLMWRPGFRYEERMKAVAAGCHRDFCVMSTHHRGSPDRPGLVLGLDQGGACEGVAYRIAEADWRGVVDYLRERELIYGVYREVRRPIALADGSGRAAMALAYVVERAHPSYAGRLPLPFQAEVLRGARGISGTGLDYLFNTLRHLRELGIRERRLERLAALVGMPGAATSHANVLERPAARSIARSRAVLRPTIAPRDRGQLARFGYRLRLTASG